MTIKTDAVLFRPEEPQVVITIDIPTAQALLAVFDCVGGSPLEGAPRNLVDKVRMAIHDLGVATNRQIRHTGVITLSINKNATDPDDDLPF